MSFGSFLDEKYGQLGAYLGSNTRANAILCAIGVVLIIIFAPGILVSVEENRTEELYVHLDSRLPHQYDVLRRYWGGLTRSQLTIHENDEGQTASKKALDAIIDAVSPFLKEDETELCGSWDGFVSSRPAECDNPAYANNIFCHCEEIASSPNQVYAEWELDSGATINITMKDTCESPDVPSVIASTNEPTALVSEDNFLSSGFVVTLSLLVSQADDSAVSNQNGYKNGRAAAQSAAIAALVEHETLLSNSSSRQDIAGSVFEFAYDALVSEFGNSYSLNVNSTLNSDGLKAMWALYASDPTSSASALKQAYDNASGTTQGDFAVATISSVVVNVITASSVYLEPILLATMSVRYRFALEERYMSHAYAEVADCVSKYIVANRSQILADVFDTVVDGLDVAENGMVDWDVTGVAAAKTVVQNSLGRGINPATNSTVQFLALVAFVSNAAEPLTSYLASKQNMTFVFDTDGVTAAVPVAIGALAAQLSTGGTTFSESDLTAIATAYVTAATDDSLVNAATAAIAQGVGLQFSVGSSVVEAVVTGVLSTVRAPSLLMPDEVVLGGAIRPLPRGWGFDRFPCSRATGLDVFREGDFDAPYRMKQLDRVSQYMYYFTQLDMFKPHWEQTQCLETRFTQPSKDGAYLNALGGDVATYSGTNFAAFTAAEEAFDAAVGLGDSIADAATAGVTAFVANGGIKVDVTNRTNSLVLGSPRGQAYLATSEGQSFTTTLGTAILTAASSASQINAQFPLIVQAFFSFGYWYRPTFGTHPLSTQNLTTEEIVAVFDDAIKNARNPNITITECISHNTDPVSFLGDPVLGCVLTWSGTALPYELSLGRLEFDDNGNLLTIGSQRVAGSGFAESHLSFETAINNLLGKETSSQERLDVHLAFEQAGIDYFYNLWEKAEGSGFADGEKHDDQSLLFQMSRSVEDTIRSAGSPEIGLLAGGAITLLVYVYLVSSNFRNAVYSHGLLALGGVFVIVLSTFSSLGLSAYLGVKFTPISTNVIPFIAVGVGVDDVLVMLAAYHIAIRSGFNSINDVLKYTLSEAGSSITFTSLTNFVAFAIASAAPIAVVRWFCFQMLVSVFLNWLFIFLIFIPLMFWDARRVHNGKAERLCIGSTSSNDSGADAEGEKVTDSFFKKVFSPVLLHNASRVFVVVCFCIAIGLSVWQAQEVKRGTRISEIATKGGYLYDFASKLETDYTMFSGYLVTVSDEMPATQQNLIDTVNNLQASEWVADSAPLANFYWLHSMLSQTVGSVTPTSDEQFYPVFATWMSGFGVTSANDLFCIDSTTDEQVDCTDIIGAFSTPPATASNPNVKLVAVRGTYYVQNLVEIADFVDAIASTSQAVEEIASTYDNTNDPDFESFSFGYVDLFYEQYAHTYYDLYVIVGSCLAGIFVVTFLFQFSIATSFVVCLLVFVVDLEVYALLPAIGITLNAFSLTNLCLAIAMAIEFTAHMAHQYLLENKDTRKEKAAAAIGFMGTPLLNGFVSTAVALLFISNSKTEFIQSYYFSMFFSTVVIAYLNGIFVLPVLLSFVGPTTSTSSSKEKLTMADGISVKKELLMDGKDGQNENAKNEESEADVTLTVM
eukprot:m.166915 g.166915  ORF g.166915 m.166915 type:complete len:1584 (-) comp13457_c1_seq1:36-4787(-)